MLLCPVCKEPLAETGRGAACENGHRFDRAREGYLYLLRSSKKGDAMGDPKSQARSRRDFLNRGYYAPLRDAMVEIVRERAAAKAGRSEQVTGAGTAGRAVAFPAPPQLQNGDGPQVGAEAADSVPAPLTLLDICCGEGYYTSAMGSLPGVAAYGFDLGKEMVRLAAKRGGAEYFVANMKDIPVPSGAFDVVTELFAPFNGREFARVLAPEGSLFCVVPGARHLWGLKEVLYDTPYVNDEKLPQADELELVDTRKVAAHVTLASQEDIEAVFQMTPYYYRTRPADRARLAGLDTLETDIEFVIGEYRHR